MYRRTKVALAGGFAAALLAACSDSPVAVPSGALPSFASVGTASACGTTTIVDFELHATGQPIGTVEAWNDANDLHVIFTSTLQSEWKMRETFVHAGADAASIPLLIGGSPKLMAFASKARHSPTVFTYEHVIPLASVGGTPGQDLAIAAIALLARGRYSGIGHGDGTQINPPALHEYFVHNVQRCGTPPPPPPGKDIVVYNDINMLDNTSLANPNNVIMGKNLVNYTVAGPRGASKDVWVDCGRNSAATQVCGGTWSNFYAVVAGEGYTISNISSSSGTLVNIPASVKVIFLINPCVAYTLNEVNALKTFADEGGRVVFIGEHAAYYGQCIPIENQLLIDLGAVMTNVGNLIDCGYNLLPGTSLRSHQITTGMTNVTIACSSEIILGPSDFPLYYDLSNTKVLSGVAAIDVNTTATRTKFASPFVVPETPPGITAASTTGR